MRKYVDEHRKSKTDIKNENKPKLNQKPRIGC